MTLIRNANMKMITIFTHYIWWFGYPYSIGLYKLGLICIGKFLENENDNRFHSQNKYQIRLNGNDMEISLGIRLL